MLETAAASSARSRMPLRGGKVRAVWAAAFSLVLGLLCPAVGVAADVKTEAKSPTETTKTEAKTEAQPTLKFLCELFAKWDKEHPERHVRMAQVFSAEQMYIVEMMQTKEDGALKSYTITSIRALPAWEPLEVFSHGDFQKGTLVTYFPRTKTTISVLNEKPVNSLLFLLPTSTGIDSLEGLEANLKKAVVEKNKTGYRLSAELDLAKMERAGLISNTQPVPVTKMTLAFQFSDAGRLDEIEEEFEFARVGGEAQPFTNPFKVTHPLEYVTFDPQKIRNEIKRFPKFGKPDKSKTFEEALSKEWKAILPPENSKSEK